MVCHIDKVKLKVVKICNVLVTEGQNKVKHINTRGREETMTL